ncbi:MAG: bifunctional folylpolyglutamate synthase/dihydrofolate synthase, partial [Bacteroidota bacterium]
GLSRVRENVGLRGRMECLNRDPLMLCDVGHNEAGVQYILQQLAEVDPADLHIIWGMVSDKDHEKILKLLPVEASYYWTRPSVPRGLPAEQLEIKGQAVGLSGTHTETVGEAIDHARSVAGTDQVIFIGGSTFTVADALTYLSKEGLQSAHQPIKTGS